MPLSMAACRTVLPFSTVTCRPSIVSVTVSISLQSYRIAETAGIVGLGPPATANFVGNSPVPRYSNHLAPGQPHPAREALWTPLESARASAFASVFEWLIAAAFLVATVAVGSLVVRELQSASTSRRAALPPRAARRHVFLPRFRRAPCRFPCCRSSTARRSASARRRGGVARARPRRRERAAGSRSRHARRTPDALLRVRGSRFILVFEPFERNGEARVAAIYLP